MSQSQVFSERVDSAVDRNNQMCNISLHAGVVYWLLKVSATCLYISKTDLLTKVYDLIQ